VLGLAPLRAGACPMTCEVANSRSRPELVLPHRVNWKERGGRWGSKQPTIGISTTYEVGLGLKKKDLVVLGTLIASLMPPFFP